MAKPTDKQIAWLLKNGVQPPQSKATARNTITYIIEGNGTGGSDQFERKASLKRALEKFVDKRVKHTESAKIGVVKSLWPRRLEDVLAIVCESNPHPAPFECHVKWDDGTSTVMSFAYIELV